ncbi:MAG: hypothetical protein J6Q39_07770 [Bacteroidales bacterium]|nr:hypothetical protein [Bacteroidales bacterium]
MSWKMIQIPSEKVYSLSEHIEKALRHAGKAMQCLEDMMPEHEMGERYMGERGNYGQGGSSYGNRSYGSYGNRDDDWDEREMNERRRRDSRGRYM